MKKECKIALIIIVLLLGLLLGFGIYSFFIGNSIKTLESKIYKYNGDKNDIKSASIEILSDTEMTLLSGDGLAQMENTKGTYKIRNNTLIYTRLYIPKTDDLDNIIWVKCNQTDYTSDNSCSDFGEKTEKFEIDFKNNTIKGLKNYSGCEFKSDK